MPVRAHRVSHGMDFACPFPNRGGAERWVCPMCQGVTGKASREQNMQRLRSPFRLRPGPGAEQRKNKARREQQSPYSQESDESGVRRSSPAEPTGGDTAVPSQHGGTRERQESSDRGQDAGSEGAGNE